MVEKVCKVGLKCVIHHLLHQITNPYAIKPVPPPHTPIPPVHNPRPEIIDTAAAGDREECRRVPK